MRPHAESGFNFWRRLYKQEPFWDYKNRVTSVIIKRLRVMAIVHYGFQVFIAFLGIKNG